MQALRAEGRPVFVDFTADWCVTCKVNERLVLDTEKMRQLFAQTDTAFVVADWTNITSGTLDGVAFTVIGLNSASIGSSDLSGADFSAAPHDL